MTWKLKRTAQCEKCPWRVDVDPHDIPNGYNEDKHRALACTIARPGDLRGSSSAMACHETQDAHCVGRVANQLGPGNNTRCAWRCGRARTSESAVFGVNSTNGSRTRCHRRIDEDGAEEIRHVNG